MLFLKPVRWRTIIALLLVGVVLNFTSVSTVHAGWFSGVKKFFTETINPIYHIQKAYNRWVKETGGKIAESASKEAINAFNSINWEEMGRKMGKSASPELLKAFNSINWEQYGQQLGAGIRTEFEAAMDKLFADKIKPLLTDIDNLLKMRIKQADNAAEARIKQLDDLIEDKLKKVDALIQHTVDRFQATADKTIAKVRTDIIDYAFDRFATERDKTVAQIRAEVIDSVAAIVNKTTAEIVAKVKAELIDHTFAELDKLRHQFRQDVEHFFNSENMIVLLDCTEEKIRLEKTRDNLEKLGEKYLKELKALTPKAQMSKLSPSGQPSTKPTTSTATDDSCYQQLGVTALEGFEYSTIYDLKKCKVLNTLTPQTPVRRIQNVYWDLHMFAKRVGCIQRNPSHFMWDWLAFESLYHFWATYRY